MSELNLQELETTAAAYEELLVPGLFQGWTERVLDAARVGPGDKVLDVACGTGVLARAAAARVKPGGAVTGLDINPGMLAVAAQLAPEVKWQQGAAESLPFENNTFDAVVSQFGLMLFEDPRAALEEMRRVLAPGGRLAVMVFDSLDNNPAYEAYVAVLERLGLEQAAAALRFPFSLGDVDKLSALFEDVGIASASVATHEKTAHFPSVRVMIEGDVKGWFPLAGLTLGKSQLETLVSEAEAVLKSFVNTDGTVGFGVSARLVTWTRA
jgi:ubiquinone/menaquinone biosynthesis C-methylase UbiE